MEIIKLKKELETLKNSQTKLIRSFKHQIELLSQFIIRVTRFYDGAHKELDEELNILRSHLGGKANFALAESSINKTNSLIERYADNFKLKNRKTWDLLQQSIKQLQSEDKVEEAVKQQALTFLSGLQQAETTIFNSLPHFEQALLLYKQALQNHEGASTPSQDIANHPAPTDTLHQQICDELLQLVNQLPPSKEQESELKNIRQRIIQGISHQELLECCLIIIKAILKEVIDERQYAEKFVISMHTALNDMSASIDHSIKHTEINLETKKKANDAIKSQLVDIGDAVENAQDLEQLKQQTAEYLQRLSLSLNERENADHDEQLNLINLLSAMQAQLTTLEQQAASYKHRLSEQKSNSHTDPLTQIPNRLAYTERVEVEIARWQRYGHALSFALIDIDLFKNINDHYGHTAGDKTLQVIAQHIQRQLRGSDFIARWGGEEFVLLLPQTNQEQLRPPLESIREHIAHIPFKFKNKNVTITISIGATQLTSDDTVESAFERADSALYKAKSDGRNCCVIQ
ncbi:diguanylate cyclase [Alteromonadaceae bacterium BrNp21-10]|nr:diguanylate cyclase [Alteromonadaceae bacterium BrNp21-10]